MRNPFLSRLIFYKHHRLNKLLKVNSPVNVIIVDFSDSNPCFQD